MKIICDIGHPAHVHLFKNILRELERKGHEYLITTRDKEMTLQLLESYKMPYVSFGRHYKNICNKVYGMFKFDIMLFNVARKFRPDIFISHGSIYAAHVSALIGKPHISMEDTGNMEQIRLYKPFTQAILTPSCLNKNLGKKQICYQGYHELAYLYPSYFQINRDVLNELDVKENEKYILFRFVSWGATHDIGHSGFTTEEKIKIINELLNYARIFISAESSLPEKLGRYKIICNPEKIHSVLHYATIVISEGAKIAAEAAILGVPSIFINTQSPSYLEELQNKYQLIYNYSSTANLKEKVLSLLKTHDIKRKWAEKRCLMLQEKIDVTKFLIWFIENYPKSVNIINQDKSFQLQFR